MSTARTAAALAAICLAASLLAACVSQPLAIPAGLTAAEMFQRAQEAVSKSDYSLAIRYYELVQKNFPDDTVHDAWASYEIAFMYHKMGNNQTAIKLLKELLARYETAGDTLPPAPRILAQELIKKYESAAPAAG